MVMINAKVMQAIADEIERARTANRYLPPEKVIALAQAIDPTCDEHAVVHAMVDVMQKEWTQYLKHADDQWLADDEATWIGQVPGTSLKELSADALRTLA